MALAKLEVITRRKRESILVVKSDIRSIAQGVKRQGKKVTRRAMQKALNQAGRKTLTRAKREIAEYRNLKIGEVGKKLKFNPATGTRLAPHIVAVGRPLSLTKLASKPVQLKRAGVRVRTRKGAAPTTLKGAFIAKMPSGHQGVFERRGKKRLPIREYTMPSIAHTLVNDVVSPRLQRFANDTFKERLRANLHRELGKLPGAIR